MHSDRPLTPHSNAGNPEKLTENKTSCVVPCARLWQTQVPAGRHARGIATTDDGCFSALSWNDHTQSRSEVHVLCTLCARQPLAKQLPETPRRLARPSDSSEELIVAPSLVAGGKHHDDVCSTCVIWALPHPPDAAVISCQWLSSPSNEDTKQPLNFHTVGNDPVAVAVCDALTLRSEIWWFW